MILTDQPGLNTSYGIIGRGLGEQLLKMGHEIAFVGFGQVGRSNFKLSEGSTAVVYDGTTSHNIEGAFLDWRPDLGIHIRDLFGFIPGFNPSPYSFVGLQKHPPILNWTAVQAADYPKEYAQAAIEQGSLCVAFTQWGANELVREGVPAERVEYCWNGYDDSVYKPLFELCDHERKKNLKKKLGWDPERPVIGAVGVADQYRKGWPILLKVASIVKKKIPNLDLCLWTLPSGYYRITHFAAAMGMKGSLLFPKHYRKGLGVSAETLCEVYNGRDAYVTCTFAEGFDVPAVEALACGTPLAVTDFPNHREVLADCSEYLPSIQYYPTNWGWENLVYPPEKAAEIVVDLLKGSDTEKKERRQRGLERAKELTFTKTAQRMRLIVNKHSNELGGVTL